MLKQPTTLNCHTLQKVDHTLSTFLPSYLPAFVSIKRVLSSILGSCQNSITGFNYDAFIKEELGSSEKQAVIKLIEKKTATKDLLGTGDQYPC